MISTRKRVVICCALAGALVTLGFLTVRWRSLLESFVTARALASAQEHMSKLLADGDLSPHEWDASMQEFLKSWGPWFRAGYLDRAMLLERMASDWEGMGPGLVASAFYVANERSDEDFIVAECSSWVHAIASSSKVKDYLVHVLLDPLPSSVASKPSATKLVVFAHLFATPKDAPTRVLGSEEYLRTKTRVLDFVTDAEWQWIIRDTTGPRERTRAGALLLLSQHPDLSVFEMEGRRALGDSSEVVRLAAAGTLALRGSGAGENILLQGMSHSAWEIRLWCLHALRALGKDSPALTEAWIRAEKDEWLLRILKKEESVFAPSY